MRVTRLGLVLLVVGALLIGCSSASKSPEPKSTSKSTAPQTTPAPATTPAPSAPKETVNVTIAPGPKGGLLWMPEMVAEGIGAFKDQGINLKVLPTTGGNDATKALLSGEADFAMLAFDHVLKNRAQGADLVVVQFLTKEPGLIMIIQPDLKDKVKSVKDLKGQTVGVSSLGGGTHMATLSLMRQAGMAPTDIQFVAASDKLAEMWDSKKIAAAMHVDPQISDLVSAKKAEILYDFRKSKDTIALYGTDYPLGTLVTRADTIQNKPELVQRMVNAIFAANTFIKTHTPAEIAAKIPADYKGTSLDYTTMVAENIEGLTLTGTVSSESMATVLRELQSNKVVPADAKVDIASSIKLDFVNKATK